MANVWRIPPKNEENKKQNLAAYVRVSSDSLDQKNSYASQIEYYTALINKNPNWELVDIYADEGLTGTKLDNRDEFYRMMNDARRGRIDMILVKSISRFARNTLDCLSALRELKEMGVTVKCEKENIDTQTLATELLISVFASMAQEESVSISQNMRWSYQRRMQRGEFITCKAPYGYKLIDGKRLAVVEESAQIVRWIFESYLSGIGVCDIAEILVQTDVPRVCSSPWSHKSIRYILQNEKYIGDALTQKTYATSAFPTRKVRNKGQKDKYYTKNTHPAIIDRETFELAQQLRAKRSTHINLNTQEHPLSQKIYCGNCGISLKRRISKSGYTCWVCRRRDRKKDLCESERIAESRIYEIFTVIFNTLLKNKEIVVKKTITQLKELNARVNRSNTDIMALNADIAKRNEQMQLLTSLRTKELISTESFLEKQREITYALTDAKKKRRLMLDSEDTAYGVIKELEEVYSILEDAKELTEFDGDIFIQLIEKIMVESDGKLRFVLYGGLKLE